MLTITVYNSRQLFFTKESTLCICEGLLFISYVVDFLISWIGFYHKKGVRFDS